MLCQDPHLLNPIHLLRHPLRPFLQGKEPGGTSRDSRTPGQGYPGTNQIKRRNQRRLRRKNTPMDHDGLSFQDRIDRFEKVLEAFEQQNNADSGNQEDEDTENSQPSAPTAAPTPKPPQHGDQPDRESLIDTTNKTPRSTSRSRSSSTASKTGSDGSDKPFPFLKKGGGKNRRIITSTPTASPTSHSTSIPVPILETSSSDQESVLKTGDNTRISKKDGGTRRTRNTKKKLPPIPKFPKFPNPPALPTSSYRGTEESGESTDSSTMRIGDPIDGNRGEKEKHSDNQKPSGTPGVAEKNGGAGPTTSGYQRQQKEPHVCMDITSFRFIPDDGRRVDMVLKKIVGDRIGKVSDAFRDEEQEEIHTFPTVFSNEVTGVPLMEAPGAESTVDNKQFITLAEFASKRAPLTQTFRSIPKKEVIPFVLIYKDEKKVMTEYRWENPDHQRSCDFINEVLCNMYEKDDQCHYAYQRTGK